MKEIRIMERNYNILELFKEKKLVKVCAPMVRYSKIQFRQLARLYGCDLCYTPMIMADSFCMSEAARQNEFKTNLGDTPLVVQFAAKTENDFVGAANLMLPYSDGVELNCGCPQRWAIKDGYGCALLKTPEKIFELVKSCRKSMPTYYSVSTKIRIFSDIKKTMELCQGLERSGASYIVIHARTASQRNEPIDTEQLRIVKESIRVPIIANGDVRTLNDAVQLQKLTGCDGVMAARGMLSNPAMFDEVRQDWTEDRLIKEYVQNWVDICYNIVVDLDEIGQNTIANTELESEISITDITQSELAKNKTEIAKNKTEITKSQPVEKTMEINKLRSVSNTKDITEAKFVNYTVTKPTSAENKTEINQPRSVSSTKEIIKSRLVNDRTEITESKSVNNTTKITESKSVNNTTEITESRSVNNTTKITKSRSVKIESKPPKIDASVIRVKDLIPYPFPWRHTNLNFNCFHHHLVFMLEKPLNRKEKRIFNNLNNFEDVLQFLYDTFQVIPKLFELEEYNRTRLSEVRFSGLEKKKIEISEDSENSYKEDGVGRYFLEIKEQLDETEDSDCEDIGSLYIED